MAKHLAYDPTVLTGTNIRGQYSDPALAGNTPTIPVTDIELASFRSNPNNFRVDNGRLVRIERPEQKQVERVIQERESAKNSILAPIEVKHIDAETQKEITCIYIPDMSLQLNTALGLHLCLSDKGSVVKLWCKDAVTSEWSFRNHSYDDLISLTKTINERRQAVSENIYSTF